MTGLDVAAVKADFPILKRKINGTRLVYLDSAGSSQRPSQVIEAMSSYYDLHHANVHRGVYVLAEEATAMMEEARAKTASFIGAASPNEIVFTKNATEAINLVAHSWGRTNMNRGDVIVLTQMEHHANIVPWQMLAAERDLEIRWIPVDVEGHLDLTDLDRILDGASLVAVSAMSNVLGTINPVRRIADAAHAAGALILADACQYVPHLPTDIADLGVDFAAFSGHKMLGPTGVGVLWGRETLLDAMPPFMGGGGMIVDVTEDGFRPDALPAKFEAGTPPIAETIGLAAAIDYLEAIGMTAVREHEVALTAYALRTLHSEVGDKLTIHGPSEPAERGGVLSLHLEGVHPHDISQVLDQHGVCVRPGHHCAKPLMRVLGVPATARASLYLYNDEADVDALAAALCEASDFFSL